MSKDTVLVVMSDVPYSTRGSIQYLYYSALGLPRCREVGSIQWLHIISTAVMSGLPEGLLVATVL